jgi:DNA-binding IclR family transcriptional regulator
MERTVSGVGTVDKALTVLDATVDGPMTLAELVDATGLTRATTHRLAAALEVHGLLRRLDGGRFAPGLRLLALGRAATAMLPLADLARPALVRLRDTTGESVQLYVREGDVRVCVASLESPHGLRTIVGAGETLPLDRGSAGRVLTGPAGEDGWVASVEEREAGVASVSAPVVAADGSVIAAVGVSGPIERLTREPGLRHGRHVVEAARRIGDAAR